MKKQQKDWDILAIGDKLISGAIGDQHFLCNLAACKGACCVEGDVGAPLEEEELAVLENIYDQIDPYLAPKGKKAIKEQGKYVQIKGEGYLTPLVDGRECAYAIFEENGTAKCGIEKAYMEGKVSFRKPISCHLYPIRVTNKIEFDFLNYDEWDICSPACSNGTHANMKIYEFTKAALVRKYGETFYNELVKMFEAREETLAKDIEE